MKLGKVISFILALVCLLFPPMAICEDVNGDFLYMINVGKGDAIIIRAEGRYYLIDTAKSGAWERVEAALDRFEIIELEGVFLTHTDKDHSGGLKKLAKSGIKVNNWYASKFFTCDEDEHPMVKALKNSDAKIAFIGCGDTVDGLFTVIGPVSRDKSNEDNNSLVMAFDNGLCRVLLTGDMEGKEELSLLLLDWAADEWRCDVFKVPNHADDDVCVYMELSDLGASVALVSTDPDEKPGTPDEILLERLTGAGMDVYRTDLSESGILVSLDGSLSVAVD